MRYARVARSTCDGARAIRRTLLPRREDEDPGHIRGQVVKVGDDFLGQSVFVSHGAYDNDGSQLHTIYGHIKPRGRMDPGERLSDGDIIGTIADARKSGGAIPPLQRKT
jgi:hypothetical protein